MSVYFLIISENERRGRRFVTVAAPNVLAWFRAAWSKARAGQNVVGFDEELRGPVDGLDTMLDKIVDDDVPEPNSDGELMKCIEELIHWERDIEVEPHFVHVETDDDEVDIEYWFFDDEFLAMPDALDRLPHPGDDDDDEPRDKYAAFIGKLADG